MKLFTSIVLIVYMIHRSNGDNATYTSKYDEVNLDEILDSERLLNGYVRCLLDNGPCTPDAKELKRNLSDAIENDCRKCTDRQKAGSDKVMHYIIDHRPDDWDKLEKKYNSDGSYKRMYLANKSTKDSNQTSIEETNDDSDDDGKKD